MLSAACVLCDAPVQPLIGQCPAFDDDRERSTTIPPSTPNTNQHNPSTTGRRRWSWVCRPTSPWSAPSSRWAASTWSRTPWSPTATS